MQDEVNEKTIALYIKTGKLTAQTLQKAMKAILSKGKKQLAKPPQGKQSLKQLMNGEKVRYRLCAEKGRDGKPAPLSGFLQGAGRGRADRRL